MNINFDKIEEIYGNEMLNLVKENIDSVIKNINYFIFLGFNDIEDIFERYPEIFIEFPHQFKNKINLLIKKIGINYVDKIEDDLSLLEELL